MLPVISGPNLYTQGSAVDHELFSPGNTNWKSHIMQGVIFFVHILSKQQEQLLSLHPSI